MTADKYPNFAALRAGEPAHAYRIRWEDRRTEIVVVAPHGGGIEPGTSEVAVSVASGDLSYYLFEGQKVGGNGTLHITSTRFDEPQGLALLQAARTVVTIHGTGDAEEVVFLGGLDVRAIELMTNMLRDQGFVVRDPASTIEGRSPQNICNAGQSRTGLQLELSKGLRRTFFQDLSAAGRRRETPRLTTFAEVVREALAQIGI